MLEAMRSVPVLVGLLIAAAAGAQSDRPLAYPQDTVTYSTDGAVMRGTPVPLGGFILHGGTSLEARWQQLIPREYLPAVAGPIVALSTVCADIGLTGAPAYRRLRITLSATSATSLSASFAANLPAPTVVLDQSNAAVAWRTQEWGRVEFAVPFPYDGRSSLVVEFRKEATASSWGSHAMPVNPDRADLPRAVGAWGAIGSGAADAPLAAGVSAPLQLRLHAATDASLTLRSDRRPAGARRVFTLGGSFDLEVHAPAASLQLTSIDTAFASYSVPGVRGTGLVRPRFHLPARVVPATGVDALTFAIPAESTLVGTRLAFQALVVPPAGSPLLSNGADLIVSAN
jgi:hypothetical protein